MNFQKILKVLFSFFSILLLSFFIAQPSNAQFEGEVGKEQWYPEF